MQENEESEEAEKTSEPREGRGGRKEGLVGGSSLAVPILRHYLKASWGVCIEVLLLLEQISTNSVV